LLQPLPGGSLAAETRAIRKRLSGIRLIRQHRSAPACVRPPAPAAPAIESLAKRIVRVIRSAREQHHAGPELEIVGRAENRMKGRTFACKHGPGANIRPRHRCRRGVARDQFRIAERARRLRASVGRTARAGAAGTAIAFCSDEERPYLRDIEKLMRRSLRVIPLATPAARNDPIERPAKAKLPRDASLASRQAPARGRAAAVVTHCSLAPPTSGAETRPLAVRFLHFRAARRQPNVVPQVVAANIEATCRPADPQLIGLRIGSD